MTKASPSRKLRRSGETEAEFLLPPAGALSERMDLIDYRLVLGLIHPEGSPILVVAWDGQTYRRLLPDQASKWADELAASDQAEALKPVIDAIRTLVRRVGEIVSAAILRRVEPVGAA